MAFRNLRYMIGFLFLSLIFLIQFPTVIKDHYMLISLLFILFTFIPLVRDFSDAKHSTRELVMIAILSATAAVSRIPFAPLPSVQPATFVIIISGMTLGPQTGFVVGVLNALVSNMVLGQGPWTPWQMYAWGMIGFSAGVLKNTWLLKNKMGKSLYGFLVGILFGWFMNIWVIFSLGQAVTWKTITAYNLASILFDLAHGLSNVFFLVLLGQSWEKTITRFKNKYGLFLNN